MTDDVGRSRAPLEMVHFAEPSHVPRDLAAPLLERGVPKEMLGLFKAANELTLLEGSGGKSVVCFGAIAYSQRACLDPQTGAVVARMVTRPEEADEEADEVVVVVNSSLNQFIDSVSAVLNRYPFVSPQASNESDENYLDRTSAELHRAAHDLTQALTAIDPATMDDPGRFWLDFIDDVEMGSYSLRD